MAAQFPLLLPASKLPPKLVVFDLDKTLIAGDSTILWTEWLYEKGLVMDPIWRQIDREMIREYDQGRLDMHAFMRKHSGAFRNIPVEMLGKLALEFAKKRIAPLAYPDAKKWVKNALQAKIPIARTVFGIDEAIGVDLVEENGFFTGEILGTPSFQEGKVVRLKAILSARGIDISDVLFFTDSRNDLPLAEAAGFTCCVNPDPVLLSEARRRSWKILRWELPLRTKIELGQGSIQKGF